MFYWRDLTMNTRIRRDDVRELYARRPMLEGVEVNSRSLACTSLTESQQQAEKCAENSLSAHQQVFSASVAANVKPEDLDHLSRLQVNPFNELFGTDSNSDEGSYGDRNFNGSPCHVLIKTEKSILHEQDRNEIDPAQSSSELKDPSKQKLCQGTRFDVDESFRCLSQLITPLPRTQENFPPHPKDEPFVERDLLLRHFLDPEGLVESSCSQNEVTKSSTSIDGHQDFHTNHPKNIACNMCAYKTRFLHSMQQHVDVVHKKIKISKCTSSEEQLKKNNHLKTHVAGVGNHVCPTCGKGFRLIYTMKRHIDAVHIGIKQFKCRVCQHRFARKSCLDKHISVVHEGVRSFTCHICHKSFDRKDVLEKHIVKWHTLEHEANTTVVGEDVRNHVCSSCGAGFRLESTLKCHIEAVHEQMAPKRFQCEVCPKRFLNKTSLRQHFTSVHRPKRSQCEVCHKRFTNNSVLQVHFNRVH